MDEFIFECTPLAINICKIKTKQKSKYLVISIPNKDFSFSDRSCNKGMKPLNSSQCLFAI